MSVEDATPDGVTIDTVLTSIDLAALCAKAAAESTGDLWNGVHRVEQVKHGAGWVQYIIRSDSSKREPLLDFTVEFGDQNGRTTLTTEVGDYRTRQKKVLGFVPAGPKKMVAQHTYAQFLNSIAASVRAADASALIRMWEGDDNDQSSVQSEPPAIASRPQASLATPTAPSVAAPPPPPPLQRDGAPTPAPSPGVAPVTLRSDPKFVPLEPKNHEIDASTTVSPLTPRSPQRWELVLPEGEVLQVGTYVIFGRDPVPGDFASPELVRVAHAASRVSKTHAVFQIVGGRITVTDLHSSNGTTVLASSGTEAQCEPGTPVTLSEGDEVELGDYVIAIRSTIAQRY